MILALTLASASDTWARADITLTSGTHVLQTSLMLNLQSNGKFYPAQAVEQDIRINGVFIRGAVRQAYDDDLQPLPRYYRDSWCATRSNRTQFDLAQRAAAMLTIAAENGLLAKARQLVTGAIRANTMQEAA